VTDAEKNTQKRAISAATNFECQSKDPVMSAPQLYV